MSKILFTHSFFYKFDPKRWQMRQPYPPLATILAASVMRTQGYEIAFFDTNLKDSPSEINPLITAFTPKYLVIYDDGFNYLTKMCLTNMREAAFELIRIGKQHNCTVIISSSDSTDHYKKYLDKGADFVIRGEGEATLQELIACLESQPDNIPHVAGTYYIQNGVLQNFKPRPLLTDLDALPMPAWDLIDMESYRDIWMKAHGRFTLNLATTRGCQYRCNWCAKPIYGNSYTTRSPQKVIEEIEFLLNKYNPQEFWMCDDIFGQHPDWLNTFSDLVQQRALSFKYIIQARADALQDEETVKALARSGCRIVWMGAESGSQKILNAMNKGITTRQIAVSRKLLQKYNVQVAFFIQLGYLGETKEDLDKTVAMILDLMPDDLGISVSYPLPGTVYYDKVKQDLGQKANWTDSADLDLMFVNTYSSAFYKRMHTYIHRRHRIKRSKIQIMNALCKFRFFSVGLLKMMLRIVYLAPLVLIDAYKLKKLAAKKPVNKKLNLTVST